ncbi:hypothetical protein IWW48_005322 [Coemansia sp. RSA 1200]|nr:hypothetical protein IWW48_005322 [Coemansia sp. RSA 1200]
MDDDVPPSIALRSFTYSGAGSGNGGGGGNRASRVFQQLHATSGTTAVPGTQRIQLLTPPPVLSSSLGSSSLQPAVVSPVSSLAWPLRRNNTITTGYGEPSSYISMMPSQQQQRMRQMQGPPPSEEEDDDDDESENTPLLLPGQTQTQAPRLLSKVQARVRTVVGWLVPLEPAQRTGVFKAVLAYALAALFPFVPFLREWLGDPDYMAPHLVTNATIWLHAARTRSALAEGGLVGVIWVCVTSCVVYAALYSAEYLHCKYAVAPAGGISSVLEGGGGGDLPDALPLAIQSKVVCLVVFIFGYSWCLAFFKANINRASVGTGTAIANIVLYLVMLREAPIVNYRAAATGSCPSLSKWQHRQQQQHRADGGDGGGRMPWPGEDEDSLAESVGKKAEHILVAVLTGMAISLAVGWFVRPTASRALLRRRLGSAFSSFRDILPQLLAPIVGDGPDGPDQLQDHLQGRRQSAGKLRNAGAKPAELKSAIHRHWEQLQALRTQLAAESLDPTDRCVWARRAQAGALVGRLEELGLRLSSMGSGLELLHQAAGRSGGAQRQETYMAVVRGIRGPVVQLSRMCDKALMAMHDMVEVAYSAEAEAETEAGTETVVRKIERLRLEMTHTTREFHANYSAAVRALDEEDEEIGAPAATVAPAPAPAPDAPEELLFAVHFFVFSLREFADELYDTLPQVEAACVPAPRARLTSDAVVPGLQALASWAARHFRALWDTGATSDLETRYEFAQFADPRSLHTPRPTTRFQRLAHAVWRVLMWSRQLNARFATKYALLVTALSLPCFWSMDVYAAFRRERLDWMVISAAAIMVPTVGGSLVVSVYRVLGTCAGGAAAFAAYEATSRAPALMYALVVLFSVPCFHIMLHGRYPKIGQFALVTFGVVLINKHVAREDRLEGIGPLAVRRTASVALGVVAGMLVTMYVWPFEARVRVRRALSWWLLTASLLYERLWSTLWQRPEPGSGSGSGPGSDEWDPLATAGDYLESELELQASLVEIRALLALTANEPRLKGPYPTHTYERITSACQRLLDAMVAARWVVLPAEETQAPLLPPSSPSQSLSLAAVEREHRDSLVTLSMYVLASALVLKTPLPAVLPPTQSAQQRVARAMQGVVDLHSGESSSGSSRSDSPDPLAAGAARARYVFYYAQVMLAWEVVRELDIIGGQMRALYGSY